MRNTVRKRSQPAFISSKFTIESLAQGVKYVRRQQQKHQNDGIVVSLLLTSNIFHTLF